MNQMKKGLAFILTAALLMTFAIAMSGCSEEKEPESPAGTVLREALSSEEFDAMAAGIADGSDMPVSVLCYKDNSYSDELTDPEAIADLWTGLCDVAIDKEKPVDVPDIDDGTADFVFKWADGRTRTFTFLMSDFFSPDNGATYYAVVNPARANTVMKAAFDYIAEKNSQSDGTGRKIEFNMISGFYWDGDGDGTEEYYEIEHYANGDEAPDAIEIKGDNGSVFLDRAYEIKEIKAYPDDEGGEFLVIKYTFGDYYSHDAFAFAELRIVDGVLTSEMLEK